MDWEKDCASQRWRDPGNGVPASSAHGGLRLPAPGACPTFERSDDVVCDPAAVEIAGLGGHAFVVDVAFRNGSDRRRDGLGWRRMRETDVRRTRRRSPRCGRSLQRTSSLPALSIRSVRLCGWGGGMRTGIGARDVPGGRMAGFQDSVSVLGVGDGFPGKQHAHAAPGGIEFGRSRVVPDGFLTGSRSGALRC